MREQVMMYCKGKCEFYENCMNDLDSINENGLDEVEIDELISVYQCMFDN